MQAGHGSSVALNIYEKTSSREYDTSIDEAQQLMSKLWHEIINLPTSVKEIDNFRAHIQLECKEIF
jgi:hypothetical protein